MFASYSPSSHDPCAGTGMNGVESEASTACLGPVGDVGHDDLLGKLLMDSEGGFDRRDEDLETQKARRNEQARQNALQKQLKGGSIKQ